MYYVNKISSSEKVVYKHYKKIHGLRMSIAFIFVFFITRTLYIPDSTWPLLTMIVVMGPMSFLGNVMVRALQRIIGTIFGALSGIIALYFESYSFPLMLVWCFIIMYVCGILALGKNSYMGLLIGITLGIVCSSTSGDLNTALLRSADVIIGSVMALIFTYIYPLRAFVYWRIKMSDELKNISNFYNMSVGHNIKSQPEIDKKHKCILNDLVIIRTLIPSCSRETKISNNIFESIHITCRNIISILSLLANAYTNNKETNFLILNKTEIDALQKNIIGILETLSHDLLEGFPEKTTKIEPLLDELNKLIQNANTIQSVDMSVCGFLWLNSELLKQLNKLVSMITSTLGSVRVIDKA